MRPSIRIEGTDAIVRNLRAMGKALPADMLVPIISEELEPMADDMRAHAARASGQLADSVTVGTQLSPAQAAAVVPIAEVEVYAGPGPLPQAIQEEFGNFRQDARAFIRPSFDGNVDKAVKNVATRGVDAILAAGEG